MTIALEGTKPKASRIFAYFKYLAQYTYATTSLPVEEVRNTVGKRFQQIHRPEYTIAYICDPLARHERPVELTEKMWLEIEVYLQNRYTDLDDASHVYRELRDVWNRRGVFAGNVNWNGFKGYQDPASWWSDQACSKLLQELAIYTLSINPTAGAAERNWSVHGFLHNKSRNRLANESVEKLVYVFTNLRIRDSVNSEMPEYFDSTEVEQIEQAEDEDVGFLEPQGVDDDDGDVSQVIDGSSIDETDQE